MAADNWLKYQTILPSAYLQAGERAEKTLMPYSGLPGFSYPIIFGLLSILFSFGKGLIFFVPALFLRKKLQVATTQDIDAIYVIDVFLVFSLGLLLTYARWYGWYGGQFWGPRFFLFTCVPAAMILAFYFTRACGQAGRSRHCLPVQRSSVAGCVYKVTCMAINTLQSVARTKVSLNCCAGMCLNLARSSESLWLVLPACR